MTAAPSNSGHAGDLLRHGSRQLGTGALQQSAWPEISSGASEQGRRHSLKPTASIPGKFIDSSNGTGENLFLHEADVLVGAGIGMAWDQSEPRLLDPRSVAVDEGELPKMREDRAIVHHLLHLVQDRLTLAPVELDSLLRVQLVDVRIAAIDIGAALDDKGLEACGRVAEGAAATLNYVLVSLLRVTLDKGCPLDRPELGADPHGLQVVERGLGEVRIRRIAEVLPGVETVRMAGLGEQFSRLFRIVRRLRRLPVELEGVRNDAAGDPRMAEC